MDRIKEEGGGREGGGFGWGEVEEWGENADNSNSITIKIKKKKERIKKEMIMCFFTYFVNFSVVHSLIFVC